MNLYTKSLELTKKFVAVPSMNSSCGERDMADYIEACLRDIPYFKGHPEQVFTQDLKNDPYGRRNVFALLKGTKGNSRETILLHGHIDTVDVEEYGKLKPYAFDCEKLMKRLPDSDMPEEARKDLASGEWLFGRGAADMKGGVAVHMAVLEQLCEHPEQLDGNILFSANPVEENLHTGIIEALDVLEKLKEKEHLVYKLAINNDFITQMFPGDTTRYVYTGSVGKLLPCFYVIGRGTHVGQCFEGFDASMTAAELVNQINLNPVFCDGYNGEYTLPPSVLKMQDLKPHYNVQTPFEAFVYFNFFVHNRQLTEIFSMLKEAARRAMDTVLEKTNERYQKYCETAGVPFKPLEEKTQVLSYVDVFEQAKKKFDGDLDHFIEEVAGKEIAANADKRNISLAVTKALCEIAGIKTPTVVLFFATPYCPHNTLKKEVPEERALYEELDAIVKQFAAQSGEKMEILQFFPSLTDSSYIKIDDDNESVKELVNNFPVYKKVYNVPLRKAKQLNIPGINYGCFGKDCHKWTERVYMPYSFGVLPQFILKTIETYLMK